MANAVNAGKLTFIWAASGTQNASATCGNLADGWLRNIHVTMPTMSANVSGDLHLYNQDGKKLASIGSDSFSSAATSAVSGLELPLEGGFIFEMQLSGIPGSAAGVSATPLTATVYTYSVI